jgi:hypothetical protein
MKRKLLLLGSAACIVFGTANAQRTCGTQPPGPEFEEWMQQKMQEMQNSNAGQRVNAVYTIPVVVHVINNGEAVGSGTNISVAQIQSQIDVLNEDYRKLNADVSNVPSVWTSVAADCQINFCLATVDPQGNTLASPGIHRVNRSTMGWTAPPYTQSYIDNTIKPATVWNVSNYLNIWVMNLGGGLLGYATFPSGSTNTGLSAPYGGTTDDGVVILYSSFGRTGNVQAPYNKGRTATHEIGHWLGLRHIWGDSGCGNDYTSDTPVQSTSNYGCPTFPHVTCSNGPNGDMFMNYMDYVDDACMYMFTTGQKTRIQTTMANGTYRASLALSTVCNTTSAALDAGMLSINAPTGTLCSTTFTPSITIKNFGTSTLTSATISYQVDAATPSTYAWTGSLATNATATVTLPSVTTTAASHTFTAAISNPNSGTDGNATNNSATSNFTVVANGQNLPFTQGFEGTTFVPTGWVLNNPDASAQTWSRTTTAFKTGTASARMDNFNYQTGSGQADELITPALNLSSASSPALTFQVAYRLYTDPVSSPNYSDTLEVLISTNCGSTWTSLYKKYGTNLTTVTPAFTTAAAGFVPTSTQWRLESVPLSSYASATNAQIKFRNISDYENYLYLDDINITSITGMNEIELGNANIYPNPTTGDLNISVRFTQAEDLSIRVYNALGEVVTLIKENSSMGGTYNVDLSERSNGIYFVEIMTGSGKVTKKVILNR